jgi:hypothetical protein
MGKYKVTMCDKGEEWFLCNLTVDAKSICEAKHIAKTTLCMMGYERYYDNIDVLNVAQLI